MLFYAFARIWRDQIRAQDAAAAILGQKRVIGDGGLELVYAHAKFAGAREVRTKRPDDRRQAFW